MLRGVEEEEAAEEEEEDEEAAAVEEGGVSGIIDGSFSMAVHVAA